MQTYTHFVMTALHNRLRKDRDATEKPNWLPPLRSRAALIGSFMPDLPLIMISAVFIIWDLVEGNVMDAESVDVVSHTGRLFNDMFFNDWRIKTAHNLFHGPLLTVLYTAIGYFAWKRGKGWGPALFWLGAACMVHTAIDIPLHYNDGPLLLFPFNLDLRFYSPISYWDPLRYGREFTVFEHLLFFVMLGYLSWSWFKRRKVRKSAETASQ